MTLKKILLLASFLLLSIFSKADTSYFTHLGVQDGLSQINILSIYQDEMGALWFGTFVGKMQEDNEHNLWICTEGGGLNFFDRKTRRFDRYTYKEGQTSAIGHNNLKCIWFQEQTGNLYIGTHTGGLTIFDTHKRTSRTLRNVPGKANSLPSDVVNDLQYYKGRLVFSTQAGISAMNMQTETFEPLSPTPYFSKCFKSVFGVSPMTYRKSNSEPDSL